MTSRLCVLSTSTFLENETIASKQRIEYARTKSYATLKREDPDFVPPSILKAQANPPVALSNRTRTNGVSESGKRVREEDGEEGRARKRPTGTQEEDADQEMEIDEEDDDKPATKAEGAAKCLLLGFWLTDYCTNVSSILKTSRR
jgi:hypothetical protein